MFLLAVCIFMLSATAHFTLDSNSASAKQAKQSFQFIRNPTLSPQLHHYVQKPFDHYSQLWRNKKQTLPAFHLIAESRCQAEKLKKDRTLQPCKTTVGTFAQILLMSLLENKTTPQSPSHPYIHPTERRAAVVI